MMQSISDSFILRSGSILADYFKDFFDQPTGEKAVIKRLPKEPYFQRQLFVEKAIKSGQRVFLQLDPVNADGYTINLHAHLKKLDGRRFLAINQNVNYIFRLSQLRYIAA